MLLPPLLDELLDWFAPDALWISAERHSDEAYTLHIMSMNYEMMVYRATLSLDNRWTLTPLVGPFSGTPVAIDWGEN